MEHNKISFDDVKKNDQVSVYIRQADNTMRALGFTEHSFAHVTKCADIASKLLLDLGYSNREAELASIAGYMHDIGNTINRAEHAQSGAIMAFLILERMGMEHEEIAVIIAAIGNHDEHSATSVNAIAAALILADKTDVRRTRVRNSDTITFDIHDRVNYAVENSQLQLDKDMKNITLKLTINNELCAVMDYFEIFLERMLLCRKAAEFLGLQFKLVINGLSLL